MLCQDVGVRGLCLIGLVACGTSGPGLTATVVATTDGQPAEGVTVLSHRDDGSQLDRQVADATGRVVIATETGGWATVIFPATIQPSTPTIAVITAPLPVTGTLEVSGPPRAKVPTVVGALAITAPPLAGVDGYDVDLGCATIRVAALPATVNVSAACLGSDTNLDVIVRGTSVDDVLGYAAARVPLADGVAMFDIATWDTSGPAIPVTLTGVAPAIALAVTSDHLTYPTLPVTDHATLWNNFTVDSSTVTARLGFATLGEITTRTAPGTPTAIAFGPDDFLPELASVVLLDDRATLAIRWSAAGFAVDSFDLHVTWQPGAQPITWDALLPPDADHARFPTLDSDLALQIELPVSPTIDIASDLRAIVTRPDEVLASHSVGFR